MNCNEIKEEIRKYLQINENKHGTFQTLWDVAKVVLRWDFIVIQAYLKKQEKSQINNLTFHPKELEKEEQKSPNILHQSSIFIMFNELTLTQSSFRIHNLH